MMLSIPYLLVSLTAIAVGLMVFVLWPDTLPCSPEAGEQGIQRQRALEMKLFALVEPLLRIGSAAIEPLPLGYLRARAEKLSERSGRALGLDGNDLIALCILSSLLGAITGFALSSVYGKGGAPGITVGALAGIAYPWFKIQDVAQKRLLTISRSLPNTIELISLAMASGLDFSAAARAVAERMKPLHPLRFELEHLLRKIALGRARGDALMEMAERVPIEVVQQFSNSVIQAEKRGTPLAEVLATQAEVMRTKRSQAAEQAAARAGVLILGPLMLIFAAVFIVLLGPFVVKYINGELV